MTLLEVNPTPLTLPKDPQPGMSKYIQTPRYFPPTLRSYLETFWTYFNCQQGPSGLTALIPDHIFSSSEEQEVEAFKSVLTVKSRHQ